MSSSCFFTGFIVAYGGYSLLLRDCMQRSADFAKPIGFPVVLVAFNFGRYTSQPSSLNPYRNRSDEFIQRGVGGGWK